MQKTTLSLSMFVAIALCILALNFPTSASPTVLQPGHDDCANAETLANLGGCNQALNDIHNTEDATRDADDPCISCCFFDVGQNDKSVWYRVVVTAPCNIFRVQTFGTDYDTVVSVWETATDICPEGANGTGCTNDAGVTEVACNDDSGGTLQSSITAFLADGTYYVEIAECTGTALGTGGQLAARLSTFPR
jgi:hypothetical protein